VLLVGATTAVVSHRRASGDDDGGPTVAVVRGPVRLTIQEVGAVEAFRKVELKSKVPGQVSEVLVDVGGVVRAGDVLVRLDPRDARHELGLAQARHGVDQATLDQATTQLDIQTRALERGGIPAMDVTRSRGDVGKVKAQLAVALADEAIARDQLSYTELRSPIDGVVLARNVQPGEMVTPGVAAMVDGKPLLVVAQVERLLVRAELSQIDVVRIHTDQRVDVKVDALPGRAFEGRIHRIAAMAQRSERRKDSNLMVFVVDVAVDARQAGAEALKPGMMADISIDLGAREGVLEVPLEAVVREGDATRLRRLDAQGKETLVDVVLGAQNEQVVEIVSGVDEGAKIRVRPAPPQKS
jgi:RND family efflux transporter MFP subunit